MNNKNFQTYFDYGSSKIRAVVFNKNNHNEIFCEDNKLSSDCLNLDLEIQKTETEIQGLKDNAPEKINKIAVETSADLLHQLIGAKVNNSSISAIVDDLSRRKMDEYYGN